VLTELSSSEEYKDLQRIVKDGSCVAFIGSGLSAGIYPSWENLIKKLCERCGVEGAEPYENGEVDTLLERADMAKERDEEMYNTVLTEVFSPGVNKREAYELLMRLEFKFYITTNFDPLLANETRRPECQCNGVYCYPDLPYRRDRVVYYIHGMVRDNKRLEVILGKRDFDRGYSPETPLYSFLHQVFTYEPILFIGCSLREPQLENIFKICHEIRRNIERRKNIRAPNRYILLPYRFLRTQEMFEMGRDHRGEEEENNRFKDLGIIPIRYDPKDQQHSGLEEIFREWCDLPPLNVLSGF